MKTSHPQSRLASQSCGRYLGRARRQASAPFGAQSSYLLTTLKFACPPLSRGARTRDNRGVALHLFIYVVYVAPKNLAADIVEVQTLGGIILLGGDFNMCIVALLDTINTSNLCELLQAPELVKTKEPNTVVR